MRFRYNSFVRYGFVKLFLCGSLLACVFFLVFLVLGIELNSFSIPSIHCNTVSMVCVLVWDTMTTATLLIGVACLKFQRLSLLS